MTGSPSSGRTPDGRFAPGHAGGRPFGARNRASRKMILAILHDFEAHREELLGRLRSSYTPSYFNTLARLMPHMALTDGPGFADYSDAEAARLVSRLRQVLAVTAEPREVLAELEMILDSNPSAASRGPADP